jgi:hypothetical protein
MTRLILSFVLMVTAAFSLNVASHEMTPTYFSMVPSHVDSVYRTKVNLYNRRKDVEYYEIGVFDANFKPIPFVSLYRIVKVDYLSEVNVDVYIKSSLADKAVYICSKSKLRKASKTLTAVSSRICSKAK